MSKQFFLKCNSNILKDTDINKRFECVIKFGGNILISVSDEDALFVVLKYSNDIDDDVYIPDYAPKIFKDYLPIKTNAVTPKP